MDIDKLRLMYGNSVKKYMGLYLLQNANNIGIICKNGIVRVKGNIDIVYPHIIVTKRREYVNRITGSVVDVDDVMIAELGDGILALRNLGDYFCTRHRILIYDRNFKEMGFNLDNGKYDEYIKKVNYKDKEFRIIIGNDLGGEREIIYRSEYARYKQTHDGKISLKWAQFGKYRIKNMDSYKDAVEYLNFITERVIRCSNHREIDIKAAHFIRMCTNIYYKEMRSLDMQFTDFEIDMQVLLDLGIDIWNKEYKQSVIDTVKRHYKNINNSEAHYVMQSLELVKIAIGRSTVNEAFRLYKANINVKERLERIKNNINGLIDKQNDISIKHVLNKIYDNLFVGNRESTIISIEYALKKAIMMGEQKCINLVLEENRLSTELTIELFNAAADNEVSRSSMSARGFEVNIKEWVNGDNRQRD